MDLCANEDLGTSAVVDMHEMTCYPKAWIFLP